MDEPTKNKRSHRATNTTAEAVPPGHRTEHPERVTEDGREVQNDPRPAREKLGGTPLGSDPRE
jgi:hypothetical protein